MGQGVILCNGAGAWTHRVQSVAASSWHKLQHAVCQSAAAVLVMTVRKGVLVRHALAHHEVGMTCMLVERHVNGCSVASMWVQTQQLPC